MERAHGRHQRHARAFGTQSGECLDQGFAIPNDLH